VRSQETLRRLAVIDEGFEDELGAWSSRSVGPGSQDRGAAAIAASVAFGSPAVCLEWSAGRALAAGATEDEIAGVLLAIAPVAVLGRVVSRRPDVATALGYDVAVSRHPVDGIFRPPPQELRGPLAT
jgi:alkylhydroperoxidase/carboxymuconolactone decarboxylase family protein YurZ